MSIAVMTEVWKEAPCAGTELLMLLALADMCNDDRECWPSVKHLMLKARVSEPQARRLLKSLERQNILKIDVQKGKGTKGRETNLYQITPSQYWAIADDTPITGDTRTPVMCDTRTPITGDTLNHHIETSIETITPLPPKRGKPKKALSPEALEEKKQVDAIIAGYIKGLSSVPATNQYNNTTTRRAALAVLKAGYTPEQVETFTRCVQGRDYWEDKKPPFTTVADGIAAYFAAHKPKPVFPIPDGHYDPAKDDGTPATPEQIQQAKAMFAELVKAKSGNTKAKQYE